MRPIAALALALSCQALIGCIERPSSSSRTAPPTPVAEDIRLRFVDILNVDVRDVPLLMAFDELATRGYTIEKLYIAASPLIADLLARGDAEIAMINNQTAWAAIMKGAGIRTVSQFTAPTGLLAASEGVHTCADMHGRRVGIPGSAGLAAMQFRLYIARRCPGIQPQVLIVPESAARAASLLAGRLDASLMPAEELLKLQREFPNRFHVLMSHAQELPDIQIDGLHVNREWAKKNPELVKDFLRAQIRAQRLIRSNPERLIDESVKRLSLDVETARAIVEAHLRAGIWDPNGGLTSRNIQSTIDFLATAKVLPDRVTATQVADLSYLEAVLAEMGRDEATPSQGAESSR